jgi:hypothetical protein
MCKARCTPRLSRSSCRSARHLCGDGRAHGCLQNARQHPAKKQTSEGQDTIPRCRSKLAPAFVYLAASAQYWRVILTPAGMNCGHALACAIVLRRCTAPTGHPMLGSAEHLLRCSVYLAVALQSGRTCSHHERPPAKRCLKLVAKVVPVSLQHSNTWGSSNSSSEPISRVPHKQLCATGSMCSSTSSTYM